MALDSGRRSASPDSSERASLPRQWQNHIGSDDNPRDKHFRKYASGIERALSVFDTSLQEWADYISFLNRLLKALQARLPTQKIIPALMLIAKRLAQCLNPSLPSGVHQKALEVYSYIFSTIGSEGLSRDLPLFLPGLAPTLSFSSLAVRDSFLCLFENHLLDLDPQSLRPAMKSIILTLLPGLEEEISEDFDRTINLLERFKKVIRPPDSQEITPTHATGDEFFWQCVFLACITGQDRRLGALAYLVRHLPNLGQKWGDATALSSKKAPELMKLVTIPEPGLLLRCFAAGLNDDQILIQRGFLDLLVTHLPLHSDILQKQVKAGDLDLLVGAAAGVVRRRDMSLNRRLWTWLIGPESSLDQDGAPESLHLEHELANKTGYFEEFGLRPLTQAILDMLESSADATPSKIVRPYKICLSLMDKWEIGGLVVPEVFLSIVDSVRKYKAKAPKAHFVEVLRSASVLFDGVESGLIYGILVDLVVQAMMAPSHISIQESDDKLDLVDFVLTHFNLREEEMVITHAPFISLAIVLMVSATKQDHSRCKPRSMVNRPTNKSTLMLAARFLELVPDRAFPPASDYAVSYEHNVKKIPVSQLLKKIQGFYTQEQGSCETSELPIPSQHVGMLLLDLSVQLVYESLTGSDSEIDAELEVRSRIFMLISTRTKSYPIEATTLIDAIIYFLSQPYRILFTSFSATVALVNNLITTERIHIHQLSALVPSMVEHAWSFLAWGEPKYHVETVRSLWLLQTVLTPFNRDIEAAISSLMVGNNSQNTCSIHAVESGRKFAILWAYSLQDQTNGIERRTAKTFYRDLRSFPRLTGSDHYDVILTRPLFLMLDALQDDRTQLFMMVKNWLNTMIGIDRVFEILASKLLELSFLRPKQHSTEVVEFSAEDDLDTCSYYLRTLSRVLECGPSPFWEIISTAVIPACDSQEIYIQVIADSTAKMTYLEFFLQVCLKCLEGNSILSDEEILHRVTQLQQCALRLLRQLLCSPHMKREGDLGIEKSLVRILIKSLKGLDQNTQVLLLEVVNTALELGVSAAFESSLSPWVVQTEFVPMPSDTTPENRGAGEYHGRRCSKSYLALSSQSNLPLDTAMSPPSALLKCIQSGLTSPSSRPVLDSWVKFLNRSLPLYRGSIFQVLIPLVMTLCEQIDSAFSGLRALFRDPENALGITGNTPEATILSLLDGLEIVLAAGHRQLLAEEARAQASKSPDQPQSFFGSMVSGVFSSDVNPCRSMTANDRLTVVLAFQDAVRICFAIWSWGQGRQEDPQDPSSMASFNYTSLRVRNRARRLLEHLFEAEVMECLETTVDIWKNSLVEDADANNASQVLKLLPTLDKSRPKHTIPAIFNAIYSRTNPGALDSSHRSTLSIDLLDADLVVFLVEYVRSLEDDVMDEIWQECLAFLKDLLGNPFPQRQILPSLLELTAVLGGKIDNTNFGDDKKMRRDLGDLFLRLLTALFTTRPVSFESVSQGQELVPSRRWLPFARTEDVVGILVLIVPNLGTVLVESDRILTAIASISANVIGPCIRSRTFPNSITTSILALLRQLSRVNEGQRVWKKDVGDAFNDPRFFSTKISLLGQRAEEEVDIDSCGWFYLLRQWVASDSEKLPEILSRIPMPSTAGIVFGVGATSARQEADRKTQLNLRRITTLLLACQADAFVAELPGVINKVGELLMTTPTSSPSSAIRPDVYMLLRALILRISAVHLSSLWPILNAELYEVLCSVINSDLSITSETYGNTAVLQVCKLLDLLVCTMPDSWQLSEWLFITDTIDSVYRPGSQYYDSKGTQSSGPTALIDGLSERLEAKGFPVANSIQGDSFADFASKSHLRRPLLNTQGGILDDISAVVEKREELIRRVLQPFFGQLSIYAFESIYSMASPDFDSCEVILLQDLFDTKSLVKAF